MLAGSHKLADTLRPNTRFAKAATRHPKPADFAVAGFERQSLSSSRMSNRGFGVW